MPSPTTATEALEQCELLWKTLARTGLDFFHKDLAAFNTLDYYPTNACPACEFAPVCAECPVDAWRYSGEGPFTNGCMGNDSVYKRWLFADTPEDRSAAALDILKLVRESKAYKGAK